MPPTTAEQALARDKRLAAAHKRVVAAQFRREWRRIRRNPTQPAKQHAGEWETILTNIWTDAGQQVFQTHYQHLTGRRVDERAKQQLVALIQRLIRDRREAETVAQFIEEAAEGITTTTRRRIQTILRRLDRPSDIRRVSRALRRLYLTDFTGKRANRIALDQVLRATATYENGAAMLAQEVTGRDYVKVWRNQGDSRVRGSHTSVGSVMLGENFKVGLAELRFPRDPAGPASETYGCRCWVEHRRL